MQIDGYMVRAEYDGERLCLDATTKAARIALAGRDHAAGPVVIPVDQIERVELKRANPVVNGRLDVFTKSGERYQAHFRRKHQGDWETLYAALGI